MQVGSLVVCINDQKPDDPRVCGLVNKWVVKDELYVVRNLQRNPIDGIDDVLLEEIVNKKNPYYGIEQGWDAERFAEVQPPMDISALLKETKNKFIRTSSMDKFRVPGFINKYPPNEDQ